MSFPNVTSSARVNVRPYVVDHHDFRSQLYTTYVNVDSEQRIIEPINIYAPELYNLCPSPIKFTNGSSILNIYLENHMFTTGDFISLSNVVSKNVVLKNVLSVKRNSSFVRITHIKHGLSLYGLFDPSDASEFEPVEYVDQLPNTFDTDTNIPDVSQQYYLLKINANIDMSIQLSNIVGSNPDKTMIGNIPINQLNRKQRVYLLFVKVGTVYVTDPDAYLIKLERLSSINYRDGDSNPNNTCVIFHNLFGIPLNYLNSGTPISENNRYPHFVITDVTDNTFDVDCSYPAIVDPDPRYSFYNYTDNNCYELGSVMGGGAQCYVRGIVRIDPGFPQPNQYTYILDRTYHNVIQARIVSSTFPNSVKAINDDLKTKNNRLYWRNYDDGEHIYHLDVTPGTYTANELKLELEDSFRNVPFITSENEYHDVTVSISDITNIVTFSSFRTIFQHDDPTNISDPVLFIPNDIVVCESAENFCIDFGNGPDGTGIVNRLINPFDPNTEQLFFYFSPLSHQRITSSPDLFYISQNLYTYTNHVSPSTVLTRGYNTFRVSRVETRALLVNFYRNKLVYDETTSINELKSFNTVTLLQNFKYNELTRTVTLPNHGLNIGDIIITDQFNNMIQGNQIYVYEITNVIDMDSFIVFQHQIGTKFKFIYDGLIINFNRTEGEDNYTYLDQILPTMSIQLVNTFGNNNTLSFTTIQPTFYDKTMIRIRHPNHGLNVDDIIELSGSQSVNFVPSNIINAIHRVVRILDGNSYVVFLPKYVVVVDSSISERVPNSVMIRYPNMFQMLFNYSDTMGEILSFAKVGEEVAITEYAHKISNLDPYANDYTLDVLGTDYIRRLPKLSLSPKPYFYICCDELYNYQNVMNPSNTLRVFTKIRYMRDAVSNPEFIFDTFVPNVCIFDDPIPYLNVLHVSIRYSDGNLVEFNERDHSFTIEIVELYDQPIKTNVSTRLDTELFVQSV